MENAIKNPHNELYKVFSLDGSELRVRFRYNEKCRQYIGEFPDFEQEPVYTSSGKPWVSAVQDVCEYGESDESGQKNCMDCGSCRFFVKEREEDIIGICVCDPKSSYGYRKKGETYDEEEDYEMHGGKEECLRVGKIRHGPIPIREPDDGIGT